MFLIYKFKTLHSD